MMVWTTSCSILPVCLCTFMGSLSAWGFCSARCQPECRRRKGFGWCKMFDFILGTAIVFLVADAWRSCFRSGAAVLTKPWKIITEISDGVD